MCPSKRYKESLKSVQEDKVYDLSEAIRILKSMPAVKFDQTVDCSVNLGVDPKQSDQMVRGAVVLPAGTGKKIKVLVFCEPEKEKDAQTAGADYIGSQDLIDKIANDGWFDFDYCIATPSMMRVVSKLGKVLGPRGLMPSPKTGTVTDNVAFAVKEAKRGKIDFRMDKLGVIHLGLGKISFSQEDLEGNIKAFFEALMAVKPGSLKGDFIKGCYLSTTMSPSLKVQL